MSRTLVLLHGVASNSTRWAEFRGRTRLEDWDILAPDLRGNASAAAPRTPLGMEVWCADIAALLDARGAARAVI
ncbi:MAG TPA: alpha/beta hydrolase, partial [Burkholderiales bacterium]|nr:alpha/beta hydrolase [Burkholderiales bacterium]